jgi:hypothetical protein
MFAVRTGDKGRDSSKAILRFDEGEVAINCGLQLPTISLT